MADEYYAWLASHWDAHTRLRVFPIREGARRVRRDAGRCVVLQDTPSGVAALCAWDTSDGALVEEGLGPRYVPPRPCATDKLVAALRKLDATPGVAADCLVDVDGALRRVAPYKSVRLARAADAAVAAGLRGATTLDGAHDAFASARWADAEEAAFAWRRYADWLGVCRAAVEDADRATVPDDAAYLAAWRQALPIAQTPAL